MTSTVASAIRPSLRQTTSGAHPVSTSSPHTPSRFISSTFSSPGSTFRQEEDAVVIELEPRNLRAGFEGESGPHCEIQFGPGNSRRVGDYRMWMPGYDEGSRRRRGGQEGVNGCASSDYELWRNDIRELDLGLLEDRLERAVREVYNKYLLTDAGSARLVLVLPSVVPHPVLSSMLSTLFERWDFPTIVLLPSPTMAAVAAGLRSALVVDIGWEETVITPIYEYRELSNWRSVRGTKLLAQSFEMLLTKLRVKQANSAKGLLPVGFDFVEEVLANLAFAHPLETASDENTAIANGMATVSLDSAIQSDHQFRIEWPTKGSSVEFNIASSDISGVVENTFFDTDKPSRNIDDHENTLPHLLYRTLIHLPPDVRSTCMSRIVFVGRGAQIPGLNQRILDEVNRLVKTNGWSPVRGNKIDQQRAKLAELAQARTHPPTARHDIPLAAEEDFVEEKLQKQKAKEGRSDIHGVLREVKSLGSWAGASMMASLKIKGFVEIEKEKYMSHGLSGAHRDLEISVLPQKMTSFGLAAAKANEKSNWTLGIWG